MRSPVPYIRKVLGKFEQIVGKRHVVTPGPADRVRLVRTDCGN
jgi:hypothetical protein